MSDKEIIKALQQVIDAQQEVIKSWELINSVQTVPQFSITSGSKPIETLS